MATLALFVSLGSVSYAVTALPAGSVGQRQLSFPLGLNARSASNKTLPVLFCPPGAPCHAPIPKVLATTSITLKRPGGLLVLGSCDFFDYAISASSSPPVEVDIGAEISRTNVTELEQYQVGVLGAPLRFWRIVSAPAGRQTIRLGADATGGSGNLESVQVSNPQIAVVALPTLGIPVAHGRVEVKTATRPVPRARW